MLLNLIYEKCYHFNFNQLQILTYFIFFFLCQVGLWNLAYIFYLQYISI